MPVYSLFQADRKNTDGDSEVQDPLKEAVKEILADASLVESLNHVAEEVGRKLTEVSSRTLEKLREMSPDVASSLNPIIPSPEILKRADVFKGVSIAGDDDIPINKRGSGVKRLILLNFFRAEAERRLRKSNTPSIIYAIEEPDTSQHTENQKKIIVALIELSKSGSSLVIITTHSSNIVKKLEFKNLRLISCDNNGVNVIRSIEPNCLPYPSLNEVNYLAFSEITEEYHNELYGFIEENKWFAEYKEGKKELKYNRISHGVVKVENKILSEDIRHQIHHPENTKNTHYTDDQLRESISQMREFIAIKNG